MSKLYARDILFAFSSCVLGVWAFRKNSEVSGPHFEPIIAACSDSSIPIEDFPSETGYHAYEPKVGVGAFNILVCLITQFLLELRQTPPVGALVWGGVILSASPFSVFSTIEGGRAGSKGPIRYPILMGILAQLIGICVMFPLVWVPSYIFGKGNRGSTTNTVSLYRSCSGVFFAIPSLILSLIVFLVDTNKNLWTISAGILGGPLLPMMCAILWVDKPPSADDKDSVASRLRATYYAYIASAIFGWVGWMILLFIAYRHYGASTTVMLSSLWNDCWINAGPSVTFMTIDTILCHIAMLWCIAYIGGCRAGIKSLLLVPLLGPGASCSLVLAELELKSLDMTALPSKQKKKQ